MRRCASRMARRPARQLGGRQQYQHQHALLPFLRPLVHMIRAEQHRGRLLRRPRHRVVRSTAISVNVEFTICLFLWEITEEVRDNVEDIKTSLMPVMKQKKARTTHTAIGRAMKRTVHMVLHPVAGHDTPPNDWSECSDLMRTIPILGKCN